MAAVDELPVVPEGGPGSIAIPLSYGGECLVCGSVWETRGEADLCFDQRHTVAEQQTALKKSPVLGAVFASDTSIYLFRAIKPGHAGRDYYHFLRKYRDEEEFNEGPVKAKDVLALSLVSIPPFRFFSDLAMQGNAIERKGFVGMGLKYTLTGEYFRYEGSRYVQVLHPGSSTCSWLPLSE